MSGLASGYRAGMADEPEIPESMLELQRRFFAASDALKALPADADPGQREQLRTAERQAALALHDARAGTPFTDYGQQKRVAEAARRAT